MDAVRVQDVLTLAGGAGIEMKLPHVSMRLRLALDALRSRNVRFIELPADELAELVQQVPEAASIFAENTNGQIALALQAFKT